MTLRMISFRRRSFRLLSMLALTLNACYTYSAGPRLREVAVPNSARVFRSDLLLTVADTPTVSRPVLTLGVQVRDSLTVQRMIEHQAVARPARIANAVAGIASLAIAAAAISHGDSTSRRGVTFNVIGVTATVVGLVFLGTTGASERQVAPGKTVLRGPVTFLGSRVTVDTMQRVITLSSASQSHAYRADSRGTIATNLVKDWSLRRFDRLEEIRIQASTTGVQAMREIVLQSTAWTIRCAKVSAQTGVLWSEPTARSKVLGNFKRDELFTVLDSTTAWLKVERIGLRSWVPKEVTKTYWASPIGAQCPP